MLQSVFHIKTIQINNYYVNIYNKILYNNCQTSTEIVGKNGDGQQGAAGQGAKHTAGYDA